MKFAIVLLACMFAACAAKSIDTQVNRISFFIDLKLPWRTKCKHESRFLRSSKPIQESSAFWPTSTTKSSPNQSTFWLHVNTLNAVKLSARFVIGNNFFVSALEALAGMLVHLTAGIAENGIGKRDILDFFNQLGQNLWSGIAPVVDGAVSSRFFKYHAISS